MMIFFPPIFLYINRIKIPLMPKNTPPMKEINGINELNPKKNNKSGTAQVKSQARVLFIFMSYIRVFFKISPWLTKAMKMATTPMAKTMVITPLLKNALRPASADSEVALPVTPKTKKINAKYIRAGMSVATIMMFLNNFLRGRSISSISGIKPVPQRANKMAPYGKNRLAPGWGNKNRFSAWMCPEVFIKIMENNTDKVRSAQNSIWEMALMPKYKTKLK